MNLGFLIICLMPIATDGDTVRCGMTDTRVRIFGIQAPETGAEGAAAAKLSLQGHSAGGLLCEPKGTSYNRVVALCRNFKGEDVGKLQIDGGFAAEWCKYSRGFYGRCEGGD